MNTITQVFREFVRDLPEDYSVDVLLSTLLKKGILNNEEKTRIQTAGGPIDKTLVLFTQFIPAKDDKLHDELVDTLHQFGQTAIASSLATRLRKFRQMKSNDAAARASHARFEGIDHLAHLETILHPWETMDMAKFLDTPDWIVPPFDSLDTPDWIVPTGLDSPHTAEFLESTVPKSKHFSPSSRILPTEYIGRQPELGMLYDRCSESFIPDVTLWDQKDLDSFIHLRNIESSNIKIENKANGMTIEAVVKESLEVLLDKVEGVTKDLLTDKNSAYHARVILKYSCKSFIEQLAVEKLIKNIRYPDPLIGIDVVTAIEYGADAFLIFDRQMNSSQECRDIEGKLKKILQKSVDGAHISEEEQNLANSFQCTFVGDMMAPKKPTTFDEAMAIFIQLPTMIRQSTGRNGSQLYGIPKKAYLYPLSELIAAGPNL